MGQADSMKIYVIANSPLLEKRVAEIIGGLAEWKEEFRGLSVVTLHEDPLDIDRRRKPWTDAILIIADVRYLRSLVPYLEDSDLRVPLIPFMSECTPANIEEAYRWGYLQTSGVVHEPALRDPEEVGLIAGLIKGEIRRSLPLHNRPLPAKKLGWMITMKPEDYEERRFVGLFLDKPIRSFMERLTYVVENNRRLLQASPWNPQQRLDLQRLFRNVGEALATGNTGKDGNLGELQDRAKKMGILAAGTGVLTRESWPRPVLLEGESGTGKSLIAEWLNRQLRASTDFELVRIATVNIAESLLESELFGTIEGAYTGAVSRPGQLLMGRGRVVFLDEIGDLPLTLQAKLLRYLDSMTFYPDHWPFVSAIFSPAFVIAATNRDLQAEVQRGTFRSDLYYRFYHRLRIPPLRERQRDIRVLVDLILQDPAVNRNNAVQSISLDALSWIDAQRLPGNHRELEQLLTRAVFNAQRAGRTELRRDDLID